MKIKKIVDICRRNGTAKLYKDDKDIQWLNCGYAIYPLYGVPELSEDEFFTVFDFTQKQRGDIVFAKEPFPEHFSTADFSPREFPCEKLSPHIPFGSRILIPYSTPKGIKFLDDLYLAPFADENREIEIYERTSTKGEAYFAVKVGMCLRAIISPVNAINKNFVENIEKIYSLCRNALDDKDAE